MFIMMQRADRYTGRLCKFANAPSTPSWCSFAHVVQFQSLQPDVTCDSSYFKARAGSSSSSVRVVTILRMAGNQP